MIRLPHRTALRAALAGLGAALALGAPSSAARTSVTPYIEAQQVLTADLNDGGDVLTYTSVAAGINASADSARFSGQLSYRYERRIAYDSDLFDNDVHSGIAQAGYQVIPGKLNINGGAFASRSGGNGAPIFGLTTRDDANVSDVYSVYAGPTLSTNVGPLEVGAQYQIGYVRVDDNSLAGVAPAGTPIRDRFRSSVVHNATASVGMSPGRLPFGWTVGGGYVREDQNRLDSTFEAQYVRGDVVVPIGPHVAVTGGVGYEKILSKQDDILRSSSGVPIFNEDGELIADPSRPRLIAYDQDGIIWDAGVIWRPSRRTELQARVGQRYGGTTVTGSLRHDFRGGLSVRANVYDSVSSFGRLLVDDVSGLPTSFNTSRNPLTSGVTGLGGCVFGKEPGTGRCFDDAFQSVASNNFRLRGANMILSGSRGLWDFGAGASYNRRRYFAPQVEGDLFSFDGVIDESYTLSGSASRQLGRNAGLSFDAYASWFDSSVALSEGGFGAGASASYYQSLFVDRLQGYAAAGIDTYGVDDADRTTLSGLIGLRYTF